MTHKSAADDAGCGCAMVWVFLYLIGAVMVCTCVQETTDARGTEAILLGLQWPLFLFDMLGEYIAAGFS